MGTKRIKLDDATTMASVDGREMLELLDQFENTPVINQAKSIDQTLMQMESDITSIRSSLEKKQKKLSLKDIDRKLDIIIKMLNGWTAAIPTDYQYTLTVQSSKHS